MSIILHVGTHKTGTTSIQAFARRHRVALRARGLWYPGFEDIGLRAQDAHHRLAQAFAATARSPITIEEADAFLKHVRGAKRPGEVVLLSAESFYGQLCDLNDERGAALIEQVRRRLEGDDVRVVMVVRPQWDFARSLYQERVKAGRYPYDFAEYLARDRRWFEYHRGACALARAFDPVHVWRFDDLAEGGLVRTFFMRLGVDVSDLASTATVLNPSLPNELIEAKLLLNRTNISDALLNRVRGRLDELSNTIGIQGGPREQWISYEAATAFAASFRSDNERLRLDFEPDQRPPFLPERPCDERPTWSVYERMTAPRFAELIVDLLPSSDSKPADQPARRNLRSRILGRFGSVRNSDQSL